MNNDIKQYIVIRKDVKTVTGEPVSSAKLAVMTAHASMAFLTAMLKENACRKVYGKGDNGEHPWLISFEMDDEVYEWVQTIFTKILLEAKTMHALERVVEEAVKIGLEEGKDFFCIRDNCLTELVPDEGSDRCFVAVGFRPMRADRLESVLKRLQLYQ